MIYDKYCMVGNIKTHYLEAGQGEAVVLLHSGEYGANATMSWEHNIEALAQHFHVYALDMTGFGYTDKVHSFDNGAAFRIQHVTDFLKVMNITEAHFIGNSLGGGYILNVATQEKPAWPIKKIITISGGGPLQIENMEFLGNYDATKEYMQRVLDLLFVDEKWKSGEYLERKYQASIIPGHWETLSAARLKVPGAEAKPHHPADYSKVKAPVLIVAGDRDPLKPENYASNLHAALPNSRVSVFENCRHCAHIEYADQFNQLAIDFLKE